MKSSDKSKNAPTRKTSPSGKDAPNETKGISSPPSRPKCSPERDTHVCWRKSCKHCIPKRKQLKHFVPSFAGDHSPNERTKYMLAEKQAMTKRIKRKVAADFPWVKFRDPSIIDVPLDHGLVGELPIVFRLIRTQKRNYSYLKGMECSIPRYLNTGFYDGSQVLSPEHKTDSDRLDALATAINHVFYMECIGLQYWKAMMESKNENLYADDDIVEIMAWQAFINTQSEETYRQDDFVEGYEPSDFLFNPGVLWQLHQNPVLFNQWLMAALYVLLGFERKTAFLRFTPMPMHLMAPLVQNVLVFLRDLRRRIGYGFLLIGYLVDIYPQRDTRVIKLIREDIVAPSLATLKVLLLEEHFQHLIEILPELLPFSRLLRTVGEDVVMDMRNYSLLDEVEDQDFSNYSRHQVSSFLFHADPAAQKSCFGKLKTKIEDLKENINKSKIYPSWLWRQVPIPMQLIYHPNSPLWVAMDTYLEEYLASTKRKDLPPRMHIIKENYETLLERVEKACEKSEPHRGCLSTLLREEQRLVLEQLKHFSFFNDVKYPEVFKHSMGALKDEALRLSKIENSSKSELRNLERKFLKQWDGKKTPYSGSLFQNLNAKQSLVEASLLHVTNKIVSDAASREPTKVYHDWGFVYYVLPQLVDCFYTGSPENNGFNDKFSVEFLNAIIELFSNDYDSNIASENDWFRKVNIYHIPKLLAFNKLMLDRTSKEIAIKSGYFTIPISKISEMLTLNAAKHFYLNDHINTPSFEIVYYKWTRKITNWLNMLFFATTESISKCSTFTTEDGIKKKSLLLAIYSMVELVTLFQVEGSAEFSAHLKHLNQLCQNLDETYTALLLEQNGGGGAECAGAASAWQRVGVVLYLLYEMRKAVDVPREYSPPEYYPEEAKLVLRHFAAKDLLKLKLAAIGLCVTEPHRRNRTITTMALVNKSSPKLFAPYTARIKKGRIRRWHDDLLLPVKHCRFCGNLDHAKLTMCTACVDNDDYPDVNWFCGHECEAAAMQKCKHEDEHVAYIMSKISI